MRIGEFLSHDLFCLPIVQPPRQDLKQFVFRQLDNFIAKLDEALQQGSHFDDVPHYPIHRILERQGHLTEKLKLHLIHIIMANQQRHSGTLPMDWLVD